MSALKGLLDDMNDPCVCLTYVITGDFTDRGYLIYVMEKRGNRRDAHVSEHTDIVIFGERAGSKLTKARARDIPSIDEKGLYSYVA